MAKTRKRANKSRRDKGFVDKNELTKQGNGSKNDISWYTTYPELTLAAGSIPYTLKPGMSFNPVRSGIYSVPIPGVLALNWCPSIGYSSSATDPASVVARSLYSKIREKYSGSLSIDAPDLAIHLVCLDSIYSYIAWLKRLYRIITAYTPNNLSMPDALLSALGFSEAVVQNLKANRVQLWENINELISMTKRFKCPAKFPYITRHYWMNDRVFMDSESEMSQVYVFNQKYFYRFAMLNTPDDVPAGGAELVGFTLGNTVEALFNYGKDLIDRLSSWEECYDINGYLMRAYEDVPSFEIDLLPQGEPQIFSYEPEVLSQIENLRTTGYTSTTYGTVDPTIRADITQNPKTNAVLCDPMAIKSEEGLDWAPVTSNGIKTVLNIHSDHPTVADTVIASRLSAIMEAGSTSNHVAHIHAGSEFIVYMYMVSGKDFSSMRRYYCHNVNLSMQSDGDYAPAVIMTMAQLQSFNWHPQSWLYKRNTSDATQNRIDPFFDLRTVTVFEDTQLKELHRVCLISEWNAYSE